MPVVVGGINLVEPWAPWHWDFDFATCRGNKEYPIVFVSGSGSLVVIGETGFAYALDTETGVVHYYYYMGLGAGFGGGKYAVASQPGKVEMDDPRDIAGYGVGAHFVLTILSYGVAGQIFGTGPYGNGAGGWAIGPARGNAFGIAGEISRTWYLGELDIGELSDEIMFALLDWVLDDLEQNVP